MQHDFKRRARRALRRAVRIAFRMGPKLPHDKQFGDPWDSPSDGKIRSRHPQALRK